MRNIFITAAVLGVLGAASAGAGDDERRFGVSGGVTAASAYVWRGFVVDGDFVLQPEIYLKTPRLGPGNFIASVWANLDVWNSRAAATDEVDYTLEYRMFFPSVELFLGHIYYDYPNAAAGSYRGDLEWYTGVSLPAAPLTPRFTLYHNYDRGTGTYLELWGGKSIPLASGRFSLDTEAKVGYNIGQFINGRGGDVLLKTGLTVPLGKKFSANMFAAYSIPYGAMCDCDDGNQKNNFFYGLKGSFAF